MKPFNMYNGLSTMCAISNSQYISSSTLSLFVDASFTLLKIKKIHKDITQSYLHKTAYWNIYISFKKKENILLYGSHLV